MARAIAVSLVALFFVANAAAVGLGSANRASIDWPFPAIFVGYAIAGALIAARARGNPVGWLLLAMALAAAAGFLTHEYAVYGLVTRPGSLPAAAIATWLSNWVWMIMLASLIFVILFFPTGSPPSPRWRPAAWMIAAVMVLATVVFGFGTLGEADQPELRNPFYVEQLAPLAEALEAAYVIYLILFGVAVASLVVRARHARPDERQQLKWMASAAVFMLVTLVAADYLPSPVSDFAWPVAMTSLPVAIAVAILRYRLYDIDVLINRTLVYGALTASLALIYVGGVVLLQSLLRPLTGGGEIAVAATTLVVVALFQPLRRRIQEAVDRRFYRSRYDAQRTLDIFSSRLRDVVDVGSLERELVSVIERTVRPSHASLWLRRERG